VITARLLGMFDVVLTDGRSAGPWERPAARRLVQLLLLSPQRQAGREQIAAALFPNLPPARAANAVSKALTMARAALGEDQPGATTMLDADRTLIRFRPELRVNVDVDERRDQYAAAMRLPAGPRRAAALEPLCHASFDLLPDEPYADWVAPVRDELQRLRTDVLTDYARGCPPDRATRAWADLADHQPTNEEAAAALIHAYLAAGQRDRAIRTFHRCRAALLDELGVEASAELAATLGDDLPVPRQPAAPAPPLVDDSTDVPTGREDLLSRLIRTCTAAGRPRAVAVIGPAGIGKTTLVRALGRSLTSSGWTVRQVTTAPDDGLSPYAGLRVLLQQLMTDDAATRYPLLDAVRRGEAPATTRTLEATRGQLAQELAALFDEAAAPAPLAVVVDDAHWMDEAQRALLARVAAGPAQRWLVLVVARNDEPHSTPPDLPLETPRLEVPPLVPDAMRELLRTELATAPPDVVEHLAQRSRGNAFFGLELARQWQLGGASDARRLRVPDRIVELLRRRIELCSAAARQLVPLVALAGPEATYELVLRTGAHDELAGSVERCMRALDELAAAHLLVETPTGLRLLHPLLRDAALTTINPIRRATLHRLLADSMSTVDGDPLGVARHRISAFAAARLVDLAPAAAEAGFAAGQQARSVFANDAAMDLLRGALDAFSVVPRAYADDLRARAVGAWVTIADIHLDAEDTEAATDAAKVAIALAATDEQRADAWAKLAGVAYRRGDMERFGATIRDGLAALREDAPAPRARLVSDLGWGLHRQGRRDEARSLLAQALPVLAESGDDVLLARCLDRLALVTSWTDPARALRLEDDALAAARRTADETVVAVVLLHRAEILEMADRPDEALVDLDAAAQRFVVAGDRYMQSVSSWVRATILDKRGDLAGALAARDVEVDLLAEVGNALNLAAAHHHRSRLLAALGRDDEAALASVAAVAAARDSGDPAILARVGAEPTGRVREG
jgi:DNA-binding SARP family transcriptional activator